MEQNKKAVSEALRKIPNELRDVMGIADYTKSTAFMFFSVADSPQKEGGVEQQVVLAGSRINLIALLLSSMDKDEKLKQIIKEAADLINKPSSEFTRFIAGLAGTYKETTQKQDPIDEFNDILKNKN